MKKAIIFFLSVALFFTACQSGTKVPVDGTYVFSMENYVMELTITEGKYFLLSENDVAQIKGVLTVTSPGKGAMDITDECYDGETWFSFEEVGEISSWEPSLPFSYKSETFSFIMQGLPEFQLKLKVK